MYVYYSTQNIRRFCRINCYETLLLYGYLLLDIFLYQLNNEWMIDIHCGLQVSVSLLQSSCCFFDQVDESSAMCSVKSVSDAGEKLDHMWPVVRLETPNLARYVTSLEISCIIF